MQQSHKPHTDSSLTSAKKKPQAHGKHHLCIRPSHVHQIRNCAVDRVCGHGAVWHWVVGCSGVLQRFMRHMRGRDSGHHRSAPWARGTANTVPQRPPARVSKGGEICAGWRHGAPLCRAQCNAGRCPHHHPAPVSPVRQRQLPPMLVRVRAQVVNQPGHRRLPVREQSGAVHNRAPPVRARHRKQPVIHACRAHGRPRKPQFQFECQPNRALKPGVVHHR
jgi:hypothetical protein